MTFAIQKEKSLVSLSVSLIKIELSSLNQLIEKEIDEEDDNLEELISSIYVDTNKLGDYGIRVWGGDFDLSWDGNSVLFNGVCYAESLVLRNSYGCPLDRKLYFESILAQNVWKHFKLFKPLNIPPGGI